MNNEAKFFPIQSLTFDPELQVRIKINKEAIADYAEQMTTEDEMKLFPPVEIVYDGMTYWLADGHHRRAAAEMAGHNKVWAVIKSGTRADALWGAILGNGKQGFGLTRADKQRAIALAITQWPDKSNSTLADAIGCGETTIRRYREQYSGPPNGEPETRKGKDGKSYPAKQKATTKKTTTSLFGAPPGANDSETDSTSKQVAKKGAKSKQETVTVTLKSSPKVKDQYSCGVKFEPDPDDDFFDWISEEERAELNEIRKTCPNRVVPQIHNFTIQNIPEHKPDQLLACLFSLFKVGYRKKLLYGLARKMLNEDSKELAIEIITTLYHEFQNQ